MEPTNACLGAVHKLPVRSPVTHASVDTEIYYIFYARYQTHASLYTPATVDLIYVPLLFVLSLVLYTFSNCGPFSNRPLFVIGPRVECVYLLTRLECHFKVWTTVNYFFPRGRCHLLLELKHG